MDEGDHNTKYFHGIACTPRRVNQITTIFACDQMWESKIPWFAFVCGVTKKESLAPVVERFDRKLSNWKGKYFSLGGRLMLIKSVLANIPISNVLPEKRGWKIFKREESTIN